MASIDYDLRYLQAGAEELQAYLLSDVLYWPVSVSAPAGERAYPPVTLGNLLLSRARLRGLSLPEVAITQSRDIMEKMEAARQHWRTAWGRKAQQDFHARLAQWQAYLNEYRARPAENANRYAYEVRQRVILGLLKVELGKENELELALLPAMDRTLQSAFVAGNFIWEKELEAAFPKAAFWFLYGELKK